MNMKIQEQPEMTAVSRELTNIESLAIAGAIKDATVKSLKGELAPGTYSGSVTAKIDFMIQRGVDSESAPTSNLLSLPVLAKALRLSGIQRENFYKVLAEVALEAMKNDEKVGDEMGEADKQVLLEIENIQTQVVAKLPKKKKAGQTRVVARVTVFEKSVSLMPGK